MIVQADARALPFRDRAVDAVLTSPPYNTGKDYPCDSWPTWEGYYDFLRAVYAECRRVARGPVVWILPILIDGHASAFFPGYPWRFACPVVRGTEAAMHAASAGAWRDGPFYIGTELMVADRPAEGRNRPSVFFIPQPWIGSPLRNRPLHPAPSPEEYVLEFLRLWPSVRSICDPFGGTGTTAVAAKRLGRVAVTVDLDPRWTRVQEEELRQGSLFDWSRREGNDASTREAPRPAPEGETPPLP